MPPESSGDERTRQLLAAIAGIGLGNDFVAMLASFGDVKLDADAVRFLTGPVIVHGNAWQDTVPKWLIQQVRGERAEIVFGLAPWPIVGPSEFTAVMMPATMEHPLHNDIVEVYLWASCHAVAKHKGVTPEEIAKQLDHRLLDDSEVIERSGRYWQDYSGLAYEIRRKVIAHARPAREFKVSLSLPREETVPAPPQTLALPGTPAPPDTRPDAASTPARVKLRAVAQPDGRVRYVRVPAEQMELFSPVRPEGGAGAR
jgi:hypothetical protein